MVLLEVKNKGGENQHGRATHRRRPSLNPPLPKPHTIEINHGTVQKKGS